MHSAACHRTSSSNCPARITGCHAVRRASACSRKWNGFSPNICRRLAKLGYVAIAPELYARQGDVSKMTDIDEIRKVVSKVPDAQVLADLDATVAWIKESGEGNVERLDS